MFGISDIPKFLLAFFIVMPVISLLHESGHVFFAWLMGGKNIKVTVGTGKVIFRLGIIEVRQYYFWYGFCTFENLRRNERISNILIFSGGALFNALGALAIVALVENGVLKPGMLAYQFTYFSLYYIFFALLPMPYPGGNFSDGKIILSFIRNKRAPFYDKIYRIQWQEDEKQWQILDHNKKCLHRFENEKEAFEKATEIGKSNRPCRILKTENEKEVEVQNYPKIPL